MSARQRAYIYVVLAVLFWGMSAPIIKIGVMHVDPITYLAYRFAFTSLIFLFAIYLFRHTLHYPQHLREWVTVIFQGLLRVGLGFTLMVFALMQTSATEVSLINATSPIWTIFLSYLLLHERISSRIRVGVGLACIGTLITVVEPILNADANHFSGLLGNLLVITANIASSFSLIFSKKAYKKHISPLIVAGSSFVLGFILILPIAIYNSGSVSMLISEISQISDLGHVSIWYMILFGGLLAHTLNQTALASIEASKIVIFSYLQPLFAFPLAFVYLHEIPSSYFLIGAACICLGVLIAEYKGSIRRPLQQVVSYLT